MQEPAGIRLALSSKADNVAVVRAALTGIAEALDFTEELTADLKTGVSEACNNVSLHAYADGQIGPMWVDVACSSDGVEATVTDRGRGITRISPADYHMGLGLAVISALADRTQFRRPEDGGAQVTMFFGAPLSGTDALARPDTAAAPPKLFAETDGHVELWCSGAELQHAVLGRILAYMAASAHFSVDGIDAVASASSALTSHVARSSERGWAGALIHSTPRNLELTVGPLDSNDWDAELARQVATLETATIDGWDLLHVTIADRRRRADD